MLVLRAAAVAGALFVFAACGADSPTAGPGEATTSTATTPAATTPAPEASGQASTPAAAVPETLKFTGTTLDGKAFDGATLASKPTVLWFWAPWCPKCRAQAEATAKVATDYQGKVNVVGVAGLDKAGAMRGFVTDQKVGGFPHLSDEAGAIWKRFEVTEQSTYVVLDAKGNKVFSGNLAAGDGLADKVADLVG